MKSYAHPETLVDPRWVAEHLNDPAVRIVHAHVNPEAVRVRPHSGGSFLECHRDAADRGLAPELRQGIRRRAVRTVGHRQRHHRRRIQRAQCGRTVGLLVPQVRRTRRRARPRRRTPEVGRRRPRADDRVAERGGNQLHRARSRSGAAGAPGPCPGRRRQEEPRPAGRPHGRGVSRGVVPDGTAPGRRAGRPRSGGDPSLLRGRPQRGRYVQAGRRAGGPLREVTASPRTRRRLRTARSACARPIPGSS